MNEELTTVPEQPTRPAGPRRWLGTRHGGTAAVAIAIAVVVGVVMWVIIASNSSTENTPSPLPIEAVALSEQGLAALSSSVDQPIYWSGPRKGYLYELNRTTDGNVYIRYLPPGVNAGAPGAKYLTIATYPFRGAFQALKNVTDAKHLSVPGGGVAVVSPKYRKSIHLAFPKVDYQVEVYDPSPARALAVVSSGRVRTVSSVVGGG